MAAGGLEGGRLGGGPPMPVVETTAEGELLGGPISNEPGPAGAPVSSAPETLWGSRFAQRMQRIRASMIRELLKLTENPDIISFAGGLPAPEVFPVEEVRAATDRVLTEHGTTALQYTTTEGYRPLRDLFVRHMARYGVSVGPENVLVTSAPRQPGGERAAHYGIPIIEDAPYGQLRYEGEHLPPLVKIDAELHGCGGGERGFTGNVLYMSTLSKTLAPGLRIAWVVAPEAVVSKLVQIKQGADLHSSTFCQYVAYEVARGGFLDQ